MSRANVQQDKTVGGSTLDKNPVCPKCGSRLPPQALFCGNCGNRLASNTNSTHSPSKILTRATGLRANRTLGEVRSRIGRIFTLRPSKARTRRAISIGLVIVCLMTMSAPNSISPHSDHHSDPYASSQSSLSSSTAEWSQFHGDASHNGVSSYPGPTSADVAWKINQTCGASAGLIVSGHQLILSCFHENIFDNVRSVFSLAENGTATGSYTDNFYYTPCVYGPLGQQCSLAVSGSVYPASGNGLLFFEDYGEQCGGIFGCNYRLELRADHVFDRSDAWSVSVPNNCCHSSEYGYGMVTYQGGYLVYSAYNSNKIWEYTATSGTYLWNDTIQNGVSAIPTVANGKIVFPNGHDVTALSTSGGAILWNFTADSPMTAPSTYADGSFFFGTLGGQLYRISGQGVKTWSTALGAAIESTPSVSDGLVFVGADDGNVYAFNETTGTQIWAFNTGGSVTASPAVSSNGIIFDGNAIGQIFAVNSTTGIMIWEYDTGTSIASSPVLDNGYLFTIDGKGDVTAFSSADFALTSGPTEITYTAPNPGASTIGASAISGFTGTISLTISSAVPTGCTATLSASMIALPVSSTVSLTAECDSATGFNIIIKGTNGSHIHSITIPVYAVGADFSISASSVSSPQLFPATSGNSTITITSLNGFRGNVVFSVSSNPPGLTCLPLDSVTTASTPRTAMLRCTASTAGDYDATVTGASGTLSHATTSPMIFHFVDFSIAASAVSPIQIGVGSRGTSSITLIAVNGLTGTVSLASSSPTTPSPTCTLPSSVTFGTSQQTITLNCSESSAQDYTVTITATIGALSHTTRSIFFHNVDFTIKVQAATLSLNSSVTGTDTVEVDPVNGFAGLVTLSFVSPSGLGCSLGSTSVVLGTSQTSALRCDPKAGGSFDVIINATAQSITHSVTVHFNVIETTSNQPPFFESPLLLIVLALIVTLVIGTGVFVAHNRRKSKMRAVSSTNTFVRGGD